MSAPRKFDEETRARAVRLYQDRLRDHGESKLAARKHVGRLLDINPGDAAELGRGRGARRAPGRPARGGFCRRRGRVAAVARRERRVAAGE
jgi:transposase